MLPTKFRLNLTYGSRGDVVCRIVKMAVILRHCAPYLRLSINFDHRDDVQIYNSTPCQIDVKVMIEGHKLTL